MTKKKKMLVVDDEVDFLEFLSIRLKANNYDVVTLSSGTEIMSTIEKEKPDAILLDVLMPGVDGLTILKNIRAKYKNLPVFIITAFSNEERRGLANKLNASGFIVKTSELQEEINNITSTLEIAERHKV